VNFAITTRKLNIAIRVALLLIVFALIYAAYTIWSSEKSKRENTVSGRAVVGLLKVVKQKPNDPGARMLLAQALAADGRYDEAIEQFSAVLKIDKKSSSALEGLGLIAMRQNEWSTAEGYWKRNIQNLSEGQFASQDQRLERAHYYMGLTLIELKKYEAAAGHLKEAVLMKRDAADTRYALAVAYQHLGSEADQRRELETALAFDPVLPEANYDLGLLRLKAGDTAGAAELFRRSIDNAPGRKEPVTALAKLGLATEHLDKARSLAQTDAATALTEARISAAIDPQSVEAARMVGTLLEKLGKPDEASAAYERILKLIPDDAEALAAVKRLEAAAAAKPTKKPRKK
jgi:tetratricopeptide (TPR) repeat protein